MNPIRISRKWLSDMVWTAIDQKNYSFPVEEIETIIKTQQSLRCQAECNTGSLPFRDAVELYKTINSFQPNNIAEVGTFIGVSTLVIKLAVPKAVIYTCDMSNDIDLKTPNIHQYPKKPSHEMFADMAEKGIKADLVYLDGRLSEKDAEPLLKIIHGQTVFVLDDFEGTEKGVANAMMLESPYRALVYPRFDHKTAISLPLTLLHLTRQEAV